MGRAILVGLVGVCVNAVLVQYVGFYLLGSVLAQDYLPIGVFCLFVVLVGINGILRRLGRRTDDPSPPGLALTRSEIVVAYVTMLVGAAIPESAFASRLIPMLPAVFYYADATNNWSVLFHRFIPHWAAPRDQEVIRQFYTNVDGGPIPWGAWVVPLATWLVPWAGMVCVMLGLGFLLRKRWMDEERLTYPLVQVPLAVVGEEQTPGFNRALIRDVVFWIAFAVPLALRSLQALHFYFPAVPRVPLGQIGNVYEFFQNPRWRELFDTTRIEVHLALVGIAVFMRQEVSASLWAFEWF